MVKRNLFRYSSVLMCVVLTAASLVGCGSKTAATTGTDTAYVTEMAAGSTEAAITQAITNELAVSNKSTLATNTRQETVYVFNDASGNKNHITVNEKITDANGNETLNKTESSENAPVTMKVTYKLDGKEIKPEDLAGKSGKVTIHFDYTNNQKKTVTINGKKQTVASLDDAANQLADGTVSLQDGTQQLSDAIPALTDGVDQLNTGASSLKDGIYAYADGAASAYEGSVSLNNNMKTYADGIGTLYNTLKDNNLDSSVASAAKGASDLAAGAVTLDAGIDSALAGAGALATGADTLSGGLTKLEAGSDKLSAGTTQLKSSLEAGKTQAAESYSTAYGSFYKVAFAVTCMSQGINPNSATPQQQAVIAAALAQSGISQTPDVTSKTQYALATGYILKNYASVKQVVAATVSAAAGGQLDEATVSSKADEQIVTMTSGLSQAYQAYNNCNTTLSSLEDAGYFDGMTSLNEGIKSANSGATQLKAGIDQLSTGAGQLSAGSKQLKSGLGTLSTGLNTLSTSVGSFSTYREGTLCSSLYVLNLNAGKLQQEGTAVLQSGLSQLTANNDTLKSGASQLADGTATLKDSSGTLADGVTQLNEGAITLKDGMAQFNSEAIEPITKLVDSDAQTAVDTIKAVVKAGQEYNSFLGKSDDKAGSVTFVYKTAGITANN